MGMDIETLRVVSITGMLGAILLYAYRLMCLVDLMKSDSDLLAGNNRLIYAGLILFIPLGIGGWLYEFVVKAQKASLVFLIPFFITILSFGLGMTEILPHATKFNFDYIGW
jgi:hypothetical protein